MYTVKFTGRRDLHDVLKSIGRRCKLTIGRSRYALARQPFDGRPKIPPLWEGPVLYTDRHWRFSVRRCHADELYRFIGRLACCPNDRAAYWLWLMPAYPRRLYLLPFRRVMRIERLQNRRQRVGTVVYEHPHHELLATIEALRNQP